MRLIYNCGRRMVCKIKLLEYQKPKFSLIKLECPMIFYLKWNFFLHIDGSTWAKSPRSQILDITNTWYYRFTYYLNLLGKPFLYLLLLLLLLSFHHYFCHNLNNNNSKRKRIFSPKKQGMGVHSKDGVKYDFEFFFVFTNTQIIIIVFSF